MIKERKVIIISMIINIIVSTAQVLSGLICNSKSMVADGLHSLSDFITDIVAFFGSKYSKKRANKNHPDGYGRFEYIVDVFIATVILILGIYTIMNSFSTEPIETSPIWILVIIISIILKLINSKILMNKGLEYNSPILITSSKESQDDATSSLGVIIIIILSQFAEQLPLLQYADIIGGVIIGLLILKTALSLLKENIDLLLGKTEENIEAKNKIIDILNQYEEIEYKDMELESHGSYHVLELDVYVLKNIKVYKLLTIESEVRRKIKKLNYRIKFVDINLSHKLETTNQ